MFSTAQAQNTKSTKSGFQYTQYRTYCVCVCVCLCSLSSSVLQGFTCTGVTAIQTTQINQLIKACRRNGKNKVQLVETQVRDWGKVCVCVYSMCVTQRESDKRTLVVHLLLFHIFVFVLVSPTADLHVQLH